MKSGSAKIRLVCLMIVLLFAGLFHIASEGNPQQPGPGIVRLYDGSFFCFRIEVWGPEEHEGIPVTATLIPLKPEVTVGSAIGGKLTAIFVNLDIYGGKPETPIEKRRAIGDGFYPEVRVIIYMPTEVTITADQFYLSNYTGKVEEIRQYEWAPLFEVIDIGRLTIQENSIEFPVDNWPADDRMIAFCD